MGGQMKPPGPLEGSVNPVVCNDTRMRKGAAMETQAFSLRQICCGINFPRVKLPGLQEPAPPQQVFDDLVFFVVVHPHQRMPFSLIFRVNGREG